VEKYGEDYTDIGDALPGYILGGAAGLAFGAYTGTEPVIHAAVFSSAAGTTGVLKSMYQKDEFSEFGEKALEEFSELFD